MLTVFFAYMFGTPCFPGKPPIAAADVYQHLEKYAWSIYASDGTPPPPAAMFGTCHVDRNIVRGADGKVVAELGCGVRILVRGITDDLGLQLGAHGQDVLDRMSARLPALRCLANGPDQGRCFYDREPDHDTDSTAYVVEGQLGEDPLTGDAAQRWFAGREIVEIDYSIWCH